MSESFPKRDRVSMEGLVIDPSTTLRTSACVPIGSGLRVAQVNFTHGDRVSTRLMAVHERLGDSEHARQVQARLQSGQLKSDMQAFKAANPGALFEDFKARPASLAYMSVTLLHRMLIGTFVGALRATPRP